MIPQKLQIKNFLSYGSSLQTIDFTNYSLICLSGKNGHGKSALLDAMTWALWGQARKTTGNAKADQGLLRLGQTQMLVIFDFIFGGKTYRIRREYMETYGKPVAILEFGMIEEHTNIFIPLTDKTVRITQEKIEQILRLDFESFSNSAFLRQGSSNEFSKKSPKDRKHILASILGLDQYEVIRKLALEKIKDAHTKKTVLMALQEKRLQELATKEILEKELQSLNEQNTALLIEQTKWKEFYTILSNNKTALQEKEKQYHTISFQMSQIQQTIDTNQKQLRELFSQWRIVNKNKITMQSLAALEQEKSQIIGALLHHQKCVQENIERKQMILTIAQQLALIEQKYKDEAIKKQHVLQLELERLIFEYESTQKIHAEREKHIQELDIQKMEINKTIAQHKSIYNEMVHTPDQISTQEIRLEKRKNLYQHFVSLGNWLSSELNTIHQKKKFVHDDTNPSCPLCEQNLSASRKRFLKTNFEKQESFITHRLQRLKRIIPLIKEKLIEEHAQLIKHKKVMQEAQTLAVKVQELEESIIKIDQQKKQLMLTIQDIASTLIVHNDIIAVKQKTLNQYTNVSLIIVDEHYDDLMRQKKQIEETIKNGSTHEEYYKKNQAKLAALELRIADHKTMQTDSTQQANRKSAITQLCLLLKHLKKELYIVKEKKSSFEDLPQWAQKLTEEEQCLEKEEIILKEKKESLLHIKGRIENQQQHLNAIQKEFQEEQKNIAQLEMVIEDYQTIATATGKDGIQALLIEEAIPEIEQEANYLLSRLTNNQAHIFIESLRDLKKGGTKETLDIKISDQAGIRPYELFSGGEAFRIDFALRIAISKLLARRAGTALQTLIIDEGFGSQDDEGLSNIMDALHTIQDDFSKIIIVSHLPTMKDQFPVQFVIEKGVQGSMVKIVEQG